MVVAIVALVVTVILLASVYYVRQYLPTISVIFWGVLVTIAILSALLGFVCLIALVLSFCSKHVAFSTMHWLDVRERRREVEQAMNRTSKMLETTIEPPSPVKALEPPTRASNLVSVPRVVHYRTVQQVIGPGQLLMGIRPSNGTLRIGTWDDQKTVLVLGSSSSGKTTTIIEKVTDAVKGGAHLAVCDPHGYKPDSLIRRITPYEPFLFPGTIFAIEHHNILRNVRLVRQELERRVHGGVYNRPLVLVVEEWNRLQRDPEIAKELTLIAQILGQEGRGFGVYGIFGAQQITGNVELRKSVISVIVHRCDKSEAELVIPARFAKFAPELKTGQSYVKDADGVTEPLQQVLIAREDVEQVAAALVKVMPPSPLDIVATQRTSELPPMVPLSTSEWDMPTQPRLKLPMRNVFETPETALKQRLARFDETPAMVPETPKKESLNVSETVKQQIIDLAKQGKSRRDIQEATGLYGEKYKIIKQVLDTEGL